MAYESPIEMIVKDIQLKQEEYIFKAVQECGVSVDREELLKALQYDRGQYEKGYADRDAEIVRCKDCKHYWKNWKNAEPENEDDLGICLASPKDDAFCSEGERKDDGEIH